MIKVTLLEKVYKGFLPIVKLVFNQKKIEGGEFQAVTREVLLRDCPVVFLTLFDKEEKKLLLVKQVRSGAILDDEGNPYTVEPIAGMVDSGERPIIAAIREAKEEANIDLSEADLTLTEECYLSPGVSNEYAYFYFANFDSKKYQTGIFGEKTESEDIETMLVDLEDVKKINTHFSVATLVSYLSAKESLN